MNNCQICGGKTKAMMMNSLGTFCMECSEDITQVELQSINDINSVFYVLAELFWKRKRGFKKLFKERSGETLREILERRERMMKKEVEG